MKLYVCWTDKAIPSKGHPCAYAYNKLVDNGHEPEVVKAYGWKLLPNALNFTSARRHVRKLTGKNDVPFLEFDDGTWIQGSREIATWAKENPAT